MAKILVVDDELADILASSLQCFDYETDQATSIRQALEKLKAGGIDLVLLDANLPDAEETNGLERIRAAYPDVKVIMATGNVNDELEKKALELGAVGYLSKPFQLEKLQQALVKALESS